MKRLDFHLYAITLLTEIVGFLTVFTIGRTIAQQGVSTTMMGLIGGSHAVTYGIVCLISGRLSDRISPIKHMVLGAMCLIGAGTAIIVLGPGHPWSCIPYAVTGAGQGLIYPVIIAWLGREAIRVS